MYDLPPLPGRSPRKRAESRGPWFRPYLRWTPDRFADAQRPGSGEGRVVMYRGFLLARCGPEGPRSHLDTVQKRSARLKARITTHAPCLALRTVDPHAARGLGETR